MWCEATEATPASSKAGRQVTKRGNGEGSIYRRRDGRWCATISGGNGRRKSIYGKTRAAVGVKLNTALKSRQDGMPMANERETVANFLAKWLEASASQLRPRTHLRYEQLLRLHAVPQLGKLRIARVAPQHLQRLYADRLAAGQSPASVKQLHAVLHKSFSDAARWGVVVRNVVDLVSPPRVVRSKIRALDPDQSRQLLRYALDDRLSALYVLALSTGMRQGELLALRWRDVDLDRGSAQVRGTLQRTKGGFVVAEPKTAQSRRQVLLSTACASALRRHRAQQAQERLQLGPAWLDADLVFTNGIGGYLEERNVVRRSFQPILAEAGLPRIRFHDLRHTAATLLLGEGVHPKVVSDMLGHSQISITLDLYSHVTPTMQRAATDAMDAILAAH